MWCHKCASESKTICTIARWMDGCFNWHFCIICIIFAFRLCSKCGACHIKAPILISCLPNVSVCVCITNHRQFVRQWILLIAWKLTNGRTDVAQVVELSTTVVASTIPNNIIQCAHKVKWSSCSLKVKILDWWSNHWTGAPHHCWGCCCWALNSQ